MGKIHQLDSQTANMIAAGEVVERPMGVAKELIENAIDAGASRIFVTAEQGGIQSLDVLDNGCGMDSEDAVNAFQRHATSKISGQNDLWQIHTLGFRGEALPSIASVSKVVLTTNDGHGGTRIRINYGEFEEDKKSAACNQGTEVNVSGLFYQTPARLKHLRSAAYENSLIQDLISRFALSHPEIAFVYVSDQREAFRTSGQGDLLEVLYQVYGREAAESAVKADFSDTDYKVSGYLIKPNVTRSSRSSMHVFLNGRMVHTWRLYQSIQDGYEDFIVKGRFPIAVLNAEMDPHILDVNVHPSKWEVRLSKEKQLECLIKDHVRDILKNSLLAPNAKISEPVHTQYAEPVRLNLDGDMPAEKPAEQKTPAETAEPVLSCERKQEEPPVQIKEPEPVYKAQRFPEMQVIGQLHDKFILCSCQAGLAVIDQHAAQERVHYEQIQKALNQNPIMMDLLVPLTLQASDDLCARADEINESIADLHITMEPFGHDTLLVRSVPAWMKEIEEEPFLQDLLDNFKQEKENKYTRLEKKKIATMACHHSIRFNRSLSMQEMQEAVRQLSLCENPYQCPHGRPTFILLDEKTLIREFGR